MNPNETPQFQPEQPSVVPPTQQQYQQPTQPNPITPQQPRYEQPQQPQIDQKDPGQGFGIAALVCSIVGFGLMGIILGFIAMSRSKKAGRKMNVMGLIGVILGFVSMLLVLIYAGLVLGNFQNVQAKARDTQRITRTNAVYSKLEEFFNEANGYPADVSITANFPGIDVNAVRDPEGGLIRSILVADSAAMDSAEAPSAGSGNELIYVAYPIGCTLELKSGSYTGIPCKGYTLSSYLEKPTSLYRNPYTKTGLQNH